MFKIRKGVAQLFLLLTIVLIGFVVFVWGLKNGQINLKKATIILSPMPAVNKTDICEVDKVYRSDAEVQDNCTCPENYAKKFTLTGYGPCKTEGMTDCPSGTFTCAATDIKWDEAIQKIKACEISAVFQTHNLKVSLKAKDGIVYTTTEAKIDNINTVVNSVKDKCPVLYATE